MRFVFRLSVVCALAAVFTLSSCAPERRESRPTATTRAKTAEEISQEFLQENRERKLYVGKNSTEAEAKFAFYVVIEAARKPSERLVNEKIESQLAHLFGPMAEADKKGVPKGDHVIRVRSVERRSDAEWVAHYDYAGTIVVENGPTTRYPVTLPLNPDTVYAAGHDGSHNPCTDHHYQDEGDFWYFWNPANSGCKLKKDADYAVVDATIKRLPNTKLTYPEYNRLADQTGTIRISVLLGMDDPEKNSPDPRRSGDVNARSYRGIRAGLEKLGYRAKLLTAAEIRKVSPRAGTNGKVPYVEELTKQGAKATVVIRMFFGASGIDEASTDFQYFLKDALESQSMMIYDGHSGLGGHLDLESIEANRKFKIAINPALYQIYYFNSCSSYPYYNTQYFARKKTSSDKRGSKNLEILTNGLATLFSVMHDTNLAILKAVTNYADGKGWASYQALANEIDSDNLFGVNGDEDNPTKPLR